MLKTLRRIIWSREMLLVAGFYLAFAVFYFLAISWSSGGSAGGTFYTYQIFLDYPLKGLLTLPIWWLMFRVLNDWRLFSKILLHLLLLPVFVKTWQQLYYLTCDLFDLGHLGGAGEWWDVYIPALFYVLQFGIFHSYDYYRKIEESRQREALLKQTALQSELTALKAQLNPHFLYNTFNTISASVPPQEEYTRELIADLADLFRYQLWASNVEVVPLKAEIDFLKKYLQLEKARFGERLQVAFEVDREAEDAPVLPMLLQPLVENAIRHGISPLVEGGKVLVSARREGDQIIIGVSDTGVGFGRDAEDAVNGHGIGLANTRRRLQLRYNSQLNIMPNQPRGTHISIHLPYEEDHAQSNSH